MRPTGLRRPRFSTLRLGVLSLLAWPNMGDRQESKEVPDVAFASDRFGRAELSLDVMRLVNIGPVAGTVRLRMWVLGTNSELEVDIPEAAAVIEVPPREFGGAEGIVIRLSPEAQLYNYAHKLLAEEGSYSIRARVESLNEDSNLSNNLRVRTFGLFRNQFDHDTIHYKLHSETGDPDPRV